jgi:arylsulfatase
VVAAQVDIPEDNGGAEGVLFAHGSRFGGHALYVRDNRLHYVNSFVGSVEQKIESDQELPTGDEIGEQVERFLAGLDGPDA